MNKFLRNPKMAVLN